MNTSLSHSYFQGYAAVERREAFRQQKRDRIAAIEEAWSSQLYEHTTDDEEPELKGFDDVMHKMYEMHGRKLNLRPKPPKTPEQLAAMAIPDEIGGGTTGASEKSGTKRGKKNAGSGGNAAAGGGGGAGKAPKDATKRSTSTTSTPPKINNNYKMQMAAKAAKKKKK